VNESKTPAQSFCDNFGGTRRSILDISLTVEKAGIESTTSPSVAALPGEI